MGHTGIAVYRVRVLIGLDPRGKNRLNRIFISKAELAGASHPDLIGEFSTLQYTCYLHFAGSQRRGKTGEGMRGERNGKGAVEGRKKNLKGLNQLRPDLFLTGAA